MKKIKKIFVITFFIIFINLITSCQISNNLESFSYTEYPLIREGISLHLDKISKKDKKTDKDILLVHGLTYSSHEFDVNYEDYSLVRHLANEGYAVWRLDIAGYGLSEEVSDGFLPDSNYASEDIHAAIDKICEISNNDKIDVLGWSWGTVTSSRCVINYPEHIRKYILYAPILSGIGADTISEPFNKNSWENASSDFQTTENGEIDYNIIDPVVVDIFCSNAWRYDKDKSPNGGRRDICVNKSIKLIELDKITVPTLIICGDKDPYLNYDLINNSINSLPNGSVLNIIEGASHVLYIEKLYYKDFQNKLISFLK